MDPADTCWLFVRTGLVFLIFPAAELSSLNCSVIRLPSCTFRYRPAQWTRSAGCNTFWEDHNRVVIAQDSEFNETLVETLTDEHIDLKICQHHLRYTLDCLKAEQTVDCRVNCSLLELDDCPPAAKFCFSESACFNSFTAGLLFGGPAGAVLLVLIICWAVSTYKRRKSAAVNLLYAAPTDQVQELEDGVLGKLIHLHAEPAGPT